MTPANGIQAARYLAPLTGLRFFAALQVVLFHAHPHFLAWVTGWAGDFVAQGYSAVGLFFVLSGFILTHTYCLAGRPVNAGTFWLARFARIYPMYAFSLLITASMLREHPDWRTAAGAMVTAPLMLQSWWPDIAGAWNSVTWSLSVEAFFYALFPFIAPPLVRLKTPLLIGTMAVAWLLAMAAPVAHMLLGPGPLQTLVGNPAGAIIFFPPLRLPEFLMGVCLAGLLMRMGNRRRLEQLAPWLSGTAAVVLIVALVAVTPLPIDLISNGLLAPIVCALIAGLAISNRGLGWFLGLRPIVLLGEASYALYLLHDALIKWTLEIVLPGGLSLPLERRWFGFVYLGVAIGISLACFLWIERPARLAIRRWADRRLTPIARTPRLGVPAP